jgi:hypothetical protein
LLDFNGRRTWYNNTVIPIGWNAYNVTIHLAGVRLNSTYYASFREHFIQSINGVGTNHSGIWANYYWFLWTYDQSHRAWAKASVGPDLYSMKDGDLIAWVYQFINATSIS